jgi:hypothetical protein
MGIGQGPKGGDGHLDRNAQCGIRRGDLLGGTGGGRWRWGNAARGRECWDCGCCTASEIVFGEGGRQALSVGNLGGGGVGLMSVVREAVDRIASGGGCRAAGAQVSLPGEYMLGPGFSMLPAFGNRQSFSGCPGSVSCAPGGSLIMDQI